MKNLITRSALARWQAVAITMVMAFSGFSPMAAHALSSNVGDVGADMDPFQLVNPYNTSNASGFWSGNTITDFLFNDSYPEATCVPVILRVENEANSTQNIRISPWFDYKHNGVGSVGVEKLELIGTTINDPRSANNLNDFSFSGTELGGTTSYKRTTGSPNGSISSNTITANISGPYEGTGAGNSNFDTSAIGGGDDQRHYNITLNNVPSDRTVFVLFCARLGSSAQSFGGSSIDLGVIGVDTSGGDASDDSAAIDPDDLTNGAPAAATLTVIKQVTNDHGGAKTVADFSLFVNGSPVTSGVASTLAPATYTVSETADSAYAATFSGDCNGSGEVTLAAGDSKTCTITNDDEPAQLTVTKIVVGGTGAVGDFPLSVGNVSVVSGVQTDFSAGTYQVTETMPDLDVDLDPEYLSTFSGNCDANGNISLANGEVKQCTITNVYIPECVADPAKVECGPINLTTGQLTVIKQMNITYAGTLTEADFSIQVDGTNGFASTFFGSSAGEVLTLFPGTYTVSELQLPGYDAVFSGDCSNIDGTVTIAVGETKTCTITNSDTPAALTVEKIIVNDNGGTNTLVTDFQLLVNGNPESWVTPMTGLSKGAYTISEVLVPGYDLASIVCVDALSQSVPLNQNGDLELETGDSVTCTVTNDDYAPTLTIRKEVINDGEGTFGPNEFFITLSASGMADVSFLGSAGQAFSLPGGVTYSVVESPLQGRIDGFGQVGTYESPHGYTASYSAGCTGSTAVGVNMECIITNNDQGSGNPGGNGGNDSGGGAATSPGSAGNSGGGGGSVLGIQDTVEDPGDAGTTSNPIEILGEVLGIQDTAEAIETCRAENPDASLITPDLDALLAAFGFTRDQGLEQRIITTVLPKILPQVIDDTMRSIVRNFTIYGTRALLHLGPGERAGVLATYRSLYGSFPQSSCDWQNALRIGQGVVPVVLSPEREAAIESVFAEIYDRAPNRAENADNMTVLIMSYGLRPDVRSLSAEIQAGGIFRALFGHAPGSTHEWDVMRGIAYGGLTVPGFSPITR